MLSRKYRLSRPLKARDEKKISSPTLIIRSVKNTLSYNRFIFIISKKVDKRAVVRNRIKRLLASYIEKIYNDLTQGLDIAITVRKEVSKTSTDILCKDLAILLKKQNLL
jgi:ribonuclease P protein component